MADITDSGVASQGHQCPGFSLELQSLVCVSGCVRERKRERVKERAYGLVSYPD